MLPILESFCRSIFIPKGFKIGPEAQECIKFANACKAWSIEGTLKATWVHIPNENSNNRHKGFGLVQKAMGKIPGAPDYVFVGANGAGWMEFKSAVGRQGPSQKAFQEWCDKNNTRYSLVRSAEEGERILREWKLLK